MVDEIVAKFGVHDPLAECHADSFPNTLTQRAGKAFGIGRFKDASVIANSLKAPEFELFLIWAGWELNPTVPVKLS
jgi:hypothetical protein